VKFSLGGNFGLSIFASGYPAVVKYSCTSAPVDPVEETGSELTSSLKYADGQYVYGWKTDKKFAGSCYQLQLKLVDGTVHVANFTFK
jgi:hypothetical protein